MDLLTVDETAKLLRVHPETVRRYIHAGRLPAVRIGRHVRIDRSAIEAFAEPVAPTRPEPAAPRQEILTGPAPIPIPRLTEEEKRRALETIAELDRFRREVAARHGVEKFPESWPDIRAAREERDRELWGDINGNEDL
jgi:excisionase family DNA binding protein